MRGTGWMLTGMLALATPAGAELTACQAEARGDKAACVAAFMGDRANCWWDVAFARAIDVVPSDIVQYQQDCFGEARDDYRACLADGRDRGCPYAED